MIEISLMFDDPFVVMIHLALYIVSIIIERAKANEVMATSSKRLNDTFKKHIRERADEHVPLQMQRS